MSTYTFEDTTTYPSGKDPVSAWRNRIKEGRRARARYEKDWKIASAFAGGKHWLEWNETKKTLEFPRQLRARIKQYGLELFTTDLLTQFLMAGVSSIAEGGDFLGQLHFIRDDTDAEEFTKQANAALRFAWDNEIEGEEIVWDLLWLIAVFGTAAARCRFDPTVGPVLIQDCVWVNGKPVLDPQQAQQAVEASFTGQSDAKVEIRPLRGQIKVDPLSPFNLIVPPGVARERDFPWEIVVRPALIDSVVAEYPRADGIKPDELTSADMIGLREPGELETAYDAVDSNGRLDGHVLVYTCFERPCPKYPNGQVDVFVGKDLIHVDHRDQLPYVSPTGNEYRSGINYFHWIRRPDRFWSRSLVMQGVGISRAYNHTRTMQREIIARGTPKVIAEEGTVTSRPTGKPMEQITFKTGTRPPSFHAGVGPGGWMADELRVLKEDLEAATGIQGVTLGLNPPNVQTYSQLALLRQQDIKKLAPIGTRFREGLTKVQEDIVYDMRTYWPQDKQILITGEDGLLSSAVFNATKIPEGYIIRVPSGAAAPKDHAAELAKITEIAQYAASVGMPLPPQWFAESLNAGKPLPLPEQPENAHLKKARWENERFAAAARMQVPLDVQPAPWDDDGIHIQEHRAEQIEAEMAAAADPNLMFLVQMLEAHIQMHIQKLMQLQMRQMMAQRQLAEAMTQGQQADQAMQAMQGMEVRAQEREHEDEIDARAELRKRDNENRGS